MKVRKVFGIETTDYLDGFQYTDSVLKFFPTAEGYFNVETGKYVYNYTDHLGNTRLSYAKNGAGTEIIEESNYYPFGLKHEGYNVLTGNLAYKYKYNGKELQESGMYDYGARFYMPDIGRWGVIDEKAEKYRSWSSYTYAVNTPINAIDPDGKDIIFVTKDGISLQYRNGNFYFTSGNLSGQIYDGRNQSISKTLFKLARAYRKIENSGDKVLIGMLHQLEKSKNIHQIQEGSANNVFILRKNSAKNYEGDGTITQYDFSQSRKESFKESEKVPSSDFSTVVHEMQHQYDYEIENAFGTKDSDKESARDPLEQRAVKTENRARKIEGLPKRINYGEDKINPNPPNYILPGDRLREERKKTNLPQDNSIH
ncbi:RHS repeat domain-containing protein [Chryseobacterium sp. CFS7]|uniref:RHS repeat domain-containing protein n=1 Tax=unclassified Chryseobacterium TaxID=2593645 RepID=UPI0038CFD58E